MIQGVATSSGGRFSFSRANVCFSCKSDFILLYMKEIYIVKLIVKSIDMNYSKVFTAVKVTIFRLFTTFTMTNAVAFLHLSFRRSFSNFEREKSPFSDVFRSSEHI